MGVPTKVTLLILAWAVTNVHGAISDAMCSKSWVRQLIITSCNPDKKDVDEFKFKYEDDIEKILEEYLNVILGSSPGTRRVKHHPKKIDWSINPKITIQTLASQQNAKLLDEEMVKERDDLERLKRSIKYLVERCCSGRMCKLEDFHGICFGE